MNFALHILQVSGKGVQVATLASTAKSFWLPRQAVTWSEPPEPGVKVSATIPRWLARHHSQLVVSRGQYAFPLTPLPGLDPDKSKELLPMADYPSDAGKGMLGRNSKAEKPSHPSHTGVCDIDGKRYRIAAWVRTNEKSGEKYFSLSFRPDEQREQPAQQKPVGGPTFDEDTIPFAMEWR